MGETLFQPDRFRAWMKDVLTGRGATCEDCRFEWDGHLSFAVRSAAGGSVVRLGPKGPDVAEGPGWAVWPAPGHAPDEAFWAASAWVAARLTAVTRRFHIPLLDLFVPNRPEHPVSFGRGLFRERIGPFLVAGRTRCGGFVFAGDRYEEPLLRYEFESVDGRLVLRVEPGPSLPGARFTTPHLSVFVEADERPPAQAAGAEVERYLGFLLSRCDLPGVRLAVVTAKRSVVADATIDFGKELGCQFFVDERGHESFDCHHVYTGTPGPVIGLYHCERDCGNYGIYEPVPTLHLNPSYFRHRPRPEDGERFWISELLESDAVMGAEEKLRAEIQAAASREGVRMVIVGGTCHTRVMGENVEAVTREEVGCRDGVAIVYHDMARLDSADHFRSNRSVWRNILVARADPDVPRRPDQVNLVGYGATGARPVREVKDLLARMGIAVGACLLPELDWEEAPRFCAASLNVVSPWYDVAQTFVDIGEWCGTPAVSPPLPLGRRGTREWLAFVAVRLFGRAPDAIPDLEGDLLRRWEEVRRRAASLPAGFVVMATQTHSVLDPSRSHGFDFPAFLADAGFPVHVLYWDPPRAREHRSRVAPADFEARLRERTGDAGVVVRAFEDARDLAGLLRDSGLRLVCSEIRFDPRLRAAGVAQFNVEDVEIGLLGGLRTAERLARRAADPFRRTYREYLGPKG